MSSWLDPPSRIRALFAGRDQDARLQHVLEHLPTAALIAAPRTGAFVALNGKAAALAGWSRPELLRLSLAEVVAAPAAADALSQIHQLVAGETRQLQSVPIQTFGGRTAVVDLRLSAFGDPASNDLLVLVLASPVEERLAVERDAQFQTQALASSERLVALFARPDHPQIENAIAQVAEMLSADAAALYVLQPEPTGLRLHSTTPAGRGFPPALGPAEAQTLRSPMRWAAPQRPEGYLYQAARAAGWAAVLAHPIGGTGPAREQSLEGVICVAYRPGSSPSARAAQWLALAAAHLSQYLAMLSRAVEVARASDLALRLSAQLAALSAQVEEGVVLVNEGGTIDEINSAAAWLLGYRSEDVTGLAAGDVLLGDAALAQHINQALAAEGAAPYVHECRLLNRGGKAFPCRVRVRSLPGGGCLVTIADLSSVKEADVKREHIDRLAYVGEAAQSFAHEVRTPLNAISTGIQFVGSRVAHDPELADAVDTVKAECQRVSALMNDMLAWAKPVTAKLRPVSLDFLLQSLLYRFDRKMRQRNVTLRYTAAASCPPAMLDPELMERVFTNLVDNALQAMPTGGQLSVAVEHGALGAGNHVVTVTVADTGHGMTEAARQQVFDPYFTTKPDGTGLGLAICKRLVTMHAGAIGVESFPGSGTVFTVTLPAAAEPPAPVEDV